MAQYMRSDYVGHKASDPWRPWTGREDVRCPACGEWQDGIEHGSHAFCTNCGARLEVWGNMFFVNESPDWEKERRMAELRRQRRNAELDCYRCCCCGCRQYRR